MEITKKIDKLKYILTTLEPGIVAVSGGKDSSVLAKLIVTMNLDFTGIFFSGPHITKFEQDWTRYILREIGLKYIEVKVDILRLKEVKNNEKLRCYHCKRYLFSKIKDLYPEKSIIEGSHLEDEKKFRPGLVALKELNILSPYKMAGFKKEDVLYLGDFLSMDMTKYPSRPCLLTRFPYNTHITYELLSKLGEMEKFIFKKGIRDFRIRLVNKKLIVHISKLEKDLFLKNKKHIIKLLTSHFPYTVEVKFLENLSGFFDKGSSD